MKARILILLPFLCFCVGTLSKTGSVHRNACGLTDSPGPPPISGNLVFFYYRDLPRAVDFYANTLGLTKVLDYGFARIFRISRSTFIGLVDEKKGMHTAADPKTVTLSFITPQTDEWFAYLKNQGLTFHSPLKSSSRLHIRGFVTRDPGGYLLEFQKFLHHPMNRVLNRRLQSQNPRRTRVRWENQPLTFRGNIVWLYYRDLPGAADFYRKNMDLRLLCDQKTSLVMDSSPTGFIGLVDERHGLHRYTDEKAVNVVFLVRDIENWYHHLMTRGLPMKRELQPAENHRVKAFMTTDPAGYILEFDRFLPHRDNRRILEALEK